MSSVARRIRRMSPKAKARMLREVESYPLSTCACGRLHKTGLPKCGKCMSPLKRFGL
jgi:hypothetical protein